MEYTTFELQPLPPFRLDLTVWVLRRRPHNVIDRWDEDCYRRVLLLGDSPALVTVRQLGTAASPTLEVTLSAPKVAEGMSREAGELLVRMLGLQADLGSFYRVAARDRRLGELAERFRGFKPTRFPTLFEGVANAVACQQLTLTVGIELLNRLTRAFGRSFSKDVDAPHAFPAAEDVAGLRVEALQGLGFSRRKGEALIALARTLVDGRLDLGRLEALDDGEAAAVLTSLRGIGRWSAEYVLLRTLGRTNLFPGDDVGGQKNLQRWLKLSASPDYLGVQDQLARWQGYGGLIYFHLLLDRLAEAGYVSSTPFP